jgi:DNA-binding MarR family transcriptional regulator
MNRIFFLLKRTFQSTLRVTRRWMARLRMTPARYDLMRAITMNREGLWQSELAGILGVTPQTVSRMLGALEARGLVGRERDQIVDRRRLWVWLTKYGWTVMRRVQKVFVSSGASTLILERATADRYAVPDEQTTRHAKIGAEMMLRHMRWSLHDPSTLYGGAFTDDD